jgi:hypothetical protein
MILGAAILTTAFCPTVYGQTTSNFQASESEALISVPQNQNAVQSVLARNAVKPAQTVRNPTSKPIFTIVAYDNCGRPIFSRPSFVAAATPTSSVKARLPVNRSITKRSSPTRTADIDSSFWDDLLANVDDPLDSD